MKQNRASSDLIGQGLEAVLNNPVYRITAQKFRAELDKTNGLIRAAEIITKVLA
ncbi:MAG TPA: hypothetical protein VJ984_06805 [Xanthomonadales bacterium]|nr:hypothetical protein [Xanthomonadales bacterium]